MSVPLCAASLEIISIGIPSSSNHVSDVCRNVCGVTLVTHRCLPGRVGSSSIHPNPARPAVVIARTTKRRMCGVLAQASRRRTNPSTLSTRFLGSGLRGTHTLGFASRPRDTSLLCSHAQMMQLRSRSSPLVPLRVMTRPVFIRSSAYARQTSFVMAVTRMVPNRGSTTFQFASNVSTSLPSLRRSSTYSSAVSNKNIIRLDALRKLTLKQEAFRNAFLETGNACRAYRRAYDCANMSAHAIEVEASRLVRHPVIALSIEQYRKSKIADTMLTLEEHMVELRKLRDVAKARGQLSAAIRAEELRGRLRGFYVEKVDHGNAGQFANMSDEELHNFIVRECEALGINITPVTGRGNVAAAADERPSSPWFEPDATSSPAGCNHRPRAKCAGSNDSQLSLGGIDKSAADYPAVTSTRT